MRESEELIERGKRRLFHTIRRAIAKPDVTEKSLREAIINDLKSFLYDQTERHPMIMPMLVLI
jgi:ribonuclease J